MATPSEEEIHDAIFGLDTSSSPGPDGFGVQFYHCCWDIIQVDIKQAIFTRLLLCKSLRVWTLTLLLSFRRSLNPSETLISGHYHGQLSLQVCIKFIATRLGSSIGDILSSYQFGFIPSRRIHTCIALASDSINFLDMCHMAIKIDITKVFDTISWDFLVKVLDFMNFSPRFIAMVKSILHSARLSILINGSPHGYFSFYQGDPLSPLLFCIAEEALARWIDYNISTRQLSVNRKFLRFLFYADDAMVFLQATTS